jgi:hypothetical protein
MVALEISTERRPSNHQSGNAGVDPPFESRECPVERKQQQPTTANEIGKAHTQLSVRFRLFCTQFTDNYTDTFARVD